MKKRKFVPAMAAALIAAASLVSGCGSNVAEHSNTYFSQMKNVVTTARSAKAAERAAAAAATAGDTEEDSANRIASPAKFTVSEDGTYSFDGVENAQYY